MPKQYRGTVTELPSKENGWFLEVTREDGELVYLSGPGAVHAKARRPSAVGDVGTLRYLTTASAGWWSWVKG